MHKKITKNWYALVFKTVDRKRKSQNKNGLTTSQTVFINHTTYNSIQISHWPRHPLPPVRSLKNRLL